MVEVIPAPTIEHSTVAELQASGVNRLFEMHAHELEPHLAPRLAPDWAAFMEAEKLGDLIVLAAWAGRELIGYAVAVIYQSLHYHDYKTCQIDVAFVSPAWRAGMVGSRLIEAVRECARQHGAQALIVHAKIGSQMERLLQLRGFRMEETVFVQDF
jgi:GNAT superfamily N-acetyltransferase